MLLTSLGFANLSIVDRLHACFFEYRRLWSLTVIWMSLCLSLDLNLEFALSEYMLPHDKTMIDQVLRAVAPSSSSGQPSNRTNVASGTKVHLIHYGTNPLIRLRHQLDPHP